jgi:hypothetical protein
MYEIVVSGCQLCMKVRESPNDSIRRQATSHHRIPINVSLIVVIDEVVFERLAKNQLGDRDEKNPR